jgi:BirA family biotin operon repressor/biotin-[acetyl-CoA-carboxylase] ligase
MKIQPPIPWWVFRFETLDSTSDEARRMVERGDVPLPFIVRADRQTKGRGRGENSWWSDEGSLLFTVGLDPTSFGLEVRHEPRLALVAADALCNVIEAVVCLYTCGIRWPNDVEYEGRKLAGILPERVETPHGLRILIGVGVNVTTNLDMAPADVRARAVSISERCQVDPSEPDEMFVWFCDKFDWYLTLLAGDKPFLMDSCNRRDCLAGRPVRVRQADRIIEGIGRGIDADGALILETDHGLETIVGGQVLRDA